MCLAPGQPHVLLAACAVGSLLLYGGGSAAQSTIIGACNQALRGGGQARWLEAQRPAPYCLPLPANTHASYKRRCWAVPLSSRWGRTRRGRRWRSWPPSACTPPSAAAARATACWSTWVSHKFFPHMSPGTLPSCCFPWTTCPGQPSVLPLSLRSIPLGPGQPRSVRKGSEQTQGPGRGDALMLARGLRPRDVGPLP